MEGLLPDEGEEASSLYHQYIVSFYFINTIFSTVGFGAPPALCVCVCHTHTHTHTHIMHVQATYYP